MTIWPAYQHFEEDDKGSIEVGKLADFVILSDNPTEVDVDNLDTLEVVETIKEGETIFALTEDEMKKGRLMIEPGSRAERSFAATIQGIVAEHEYTALPASRQNFFTRTALKASLHTGACVPSAILAILTQETEQ
jgi:hypothetical protein